MQLITSKKRKRTVETPLPAVSTRGVVCAQMVLPQEAEETLAETVLLQAETISPFEEGTYTTAFEVVGRLEGELHVLIAVASDEALEEPWHAFLKGRKALGEMPLDLSALGWIEAMRRAEPTLQKGTHLAVLQVPQESLLVLFREGVPVFFRALSVPTPQAELQRAAMLMLAQPVASGAAVETIFSFAPKSISLEGLTVLLGDVPVLVHALEDEAGAEAFLQQGLVARAEADAPFDLTPESWRAEAKAAKQKRLMLIAGACLLVLWACCAGFLLVKPKLMAHRLKEVQKQIQAQVPERRAVEEMQHRIALIERYQDRSNSSIELFRLLCATKPKGILFLSLTFRQKQVLNITGTAEDTSEVYTYKDALQKDERIQEVKITRLQQDAKTRKQRFAIDITLAGGEEETL